MPHRCIGRTQMAFCNEIAAWSRSLSRGYNRTLSLNCQNGLQAVAQRHKGQNGCIRCGNTRSFRLSSVCLDRDLRPLFPQEERWDYGIGVEDTGGNLVRVVWIEVHPAYPKEVIKMLNKLEWLRDRKAKYQRWSRHHHEYYWAVPPGSGVYIPKHVPQYKKLRKSLLKGPQKVVNVC